MEQSCEHCCTGKCDFLSIEKQIGRRVLSEAASFVDFANNNNREHYRSWVTYIAQSRKERTNLGIKHDNWLSRTVLHQWRMVRVMLQEENKVAEQAEVARVMKLKTVWT